MRFACFICGGGNLGISTAEMAARGWTIRRDGRRRLLSHGGKVLPIPCGIACGIKAAQAGVRYLNSQQQLEDMATIAGGMPRIDYGDLCKPVTKLVKIVQPISS